MPVGLLTVRRAVNRVPVGLHAGLHADREEGGDHAPVRLQADREEGGDHIRI